VSSLVTVLRIVRSCSIDIFRVHKLFILSLASHCPCFSTLLPPEDRYFPYPFLVANFFPIFFKLSTTPYTSFACSVQCNVSSLLLSVSFVVVVVVVVVCCVDWFVGEASGSECEDVCRVQFW